MWLLKLHFAFSILCLLTFMGFKRVYAETIKKNGYAGEKEKRKHSYWIFFIPLMNILALITLFVMVALKKEDFEKICEGAKNDKETEHE